MAIEIDLKGKVAVVTGAGRGIGKAIAIAMAEAGADVVLAARTAAQLETTAQEIRSKGGQLSISWAVCIFWLIMRLSCPPHH